MRCRKLVYAYEILEKNQSAVAEPLEIQNVFRIMNILALKYRKRAYICSLQHQMYVYSTGTLAFIVTDSLALQVDDIN